MTDEEQKELGEAIYKALKALQDGVSSLNNRVQELEEKDSKLNEILVQQAESNVKQSLLNEHFGNYIRGK